MPVAQYMTHWTTHHERLGYSNYTTTKGTNSMYVSSWCLFGPETQIHIAYEHGKHDDTC